MSQLPLFTAPELTGRCPDCRRKLRWLYSPARPRSPWDEGAEDWTHGAEWAWCRCSPRVARACRPAQSPPTAGVAAI